MPETGVSVGEISRLLKERFGYDVHIDGDLVETPAGGLALTVRGNGVPPKELQRAGYGRFLVTTVLRVGIGDRRCIAQYGAAQASLRNPVSTDARFSPSSGDR